MELYEKFITEQLNEKGTLEKIDFHYPDNYNFAFDIVDWYGQNEPDRKAMIWVSNEEEEKVFTFADIMKESAKTAHYLRSIGIKKGDKVLVVLRRHYEWWFVMMALCKIGAIVIPATDQLKEHDFIYRFNSAGVSAIICTATGNVIGEAESAADKCGVNIRVITNGEREGWSCFSKEYVKFPDVYTRADNPEDTKADEIMLMYFTSGTTAYPKIAAHMHTYSLAHFTTAHNWHNVDPNGIHFTVAETGWGKAVWGKLYGQWICGACVFVYDFAKFDQTKLLSKFGKYKITTFCAPPTIYRFMIKEDLSKYDLSSLKYITTAGEALNPEVFNRMKEATGLSIMEGFGQTETTLTVANFTGMVPKPGSMGKPNPQYDIKILDSDGNIITSIGEEGEVCIDISKKRPLGLFKEYYRDEVQTKEAMHDGYYHTGDMVWVDEDGYYWYVGRTDDIIKSSGYRIGPFEIENVLMEHPAVLECAVTGVPDPVRGQVVKATIVLAKGYTESEELKKDIQDFVKRETAPYKYPRIIDIVEELPKTISGKIKRTELRKKN